MHKEVSLKNVRERAESYYRNGDFFCAESIVKTIKEEFALDLPDEIVAMASGFATGIGGAGCTCGAVVGGVMSLGMCFGRIQPGDSRVDKTLRLSRELHDKFQDKHRLLCCRSLTAGKKNDSPERRSQCINFTGEVAADTARIIARELHIDIAEEASLSAASIV
jgi:C_GCAxxG_C_C family probable redox protein